jgi:hypothetical protein
MLGVAGFAAAMDYFYIAMDGFTSCALQFQVRRERHGGSSRLRSNS